MKFVRRLVGCDCSQHQGVARSSPGARRCPLKGCRARSLACRVIVTLGRLQSARGAVVRDGFADSDRE
eukprot:15444961-Alexandrium_andersonii.AAC.1